VPPRTERTPADVAPPRGCGRRRALASLVVATAFGPVVLLAIHGCTSLRAGSDRGNAGGDADTDGGIGAPSTDGGDGAAGDDASTQDGTMPEDAHVLADGQSPPPPDGIALPWDGVAPDDGGGVAYSGGIVLQDFGEGGFELDSVFVSGSELSLPFLGTSTTNFCQYAPKTTGMNPVPLSAGTITVTDDDAGLLATQMAFPPGIYQSVTNPPTATLAWHPGDALTARAAGGAVTGFTVTVEGVTPVVVTPSLASPLTIPRSTDLTFTFTPDPLQIPGETVMVVIDAGDGGTVTCGAPDGFGQLPVYASSLSSLPATASATINLVRYSYFFAPIANANVEVVESSTLNGTATVQ
jgi:hypothetical protein